MHEQRNLILAIVISMVVLFGFQYFFAPPPPEPETQTQTAEQAPGAEAPPVPGTPGTAPTPDSAAAAAPETREAALADDPRLPINEGVADARMEGSIALTGGRFDDIVLTDYHVTIDPDSPNIVVLSPPGSPAPYYANFGWVAGSGVTAPLPGADTVWEADGTVLTPETPVTLTWDNGEGLIFKRRIEIDRNYMFTVSQTVENNTGAAVTLHPYGLISRTGTPETLGFYILHEGPIGVIDGSLTEHDYDDVREETFTQATRGGWVGITDKYWLAALVPDSNSEVTTRFTYSPSGPGKYQVDYTGGATTVAPGAAATTTNRLFSGAKEVTLLASYQKELGIEKFDLAVDFGHLWFLTKPIFYVLHYFHAVLGNFGLAILLLTVIFKAIFFPLANKSYVAMSKLKKLQPKMMALREQYGDDKQRMNQEVMALYKKEGANPVAGCLPIIVQIPVFFALYKVLFVTIEMRHAPFFGWIHDLSSPDPTSFANLFGLLPYTPPDFLMIGVWPLAMGLTMFLQQKLNPAPADPVQARVMMMLPLVFIFLFATFPAGLVIYWTWNNILSIAQQWVIMRRMGVQP
ncbi:MAG: membrane protein insertase YidC [Rhodospirillaceae bacterium]|nr:membrane protein insertase YidC [Rhodospirillaceae bacterium]